METEYKQMEVFKEEAEKGLIPIDKVECKRIIEGVLFGLGRAVTVQELGRACELPPADARQLVRELAADYEERESALLIREIDGLFQMCTSPRYYENLIRVISIPRKQELTQVVLETLAIVACDPPVTKLEIEKIRGVKSDHAVNKLLEYGLIEETGRKDAPGRPALFAPTEEFYRRFGVMDTPHMPSVGEAMESRIEDEVMQELREAFGDEAPAAEGPGPEEDAWNE